MIKDGIGDRLINVNNSVLNTPGFRGAGWSSGYTNSQNVAASIKRTYSPPIPTTAAVSSEYYRLANGSADDSRGFNPGFGDEGEDEEGGMVTGKSTSDVFGMRYHARGGKRARRRDRHQQDQRQGDAEDDDSSDLSDESDDDGDLTQRFVAESSFLSSLNTFWRSDTI